MNDRDEHIVQSLRRWITGEIDQKEENRLDRQAREDDFLGEALEGYRRFPTGNHQERMERMREQLQRNSQGRKKSGALLISMPYRIAAAVALLLAVGLFWWLQPTTGMDLAEAPQSESIREESTESSEKQGAVEIPENDSEADGSVTDLAATDIRQEALRNESELEPNSEDAVEERSAAAGSPNEDPAEAASESLARSNTAARLADSSRRSREPIELEEDLAPISPPAPPPPPLSQNNDFAIGGVRLQVPQGSRVVTGQVLDRSGSPLNGVLVVTPGDRTGTITNINGQYEILLDSNTQRLEFQRSGYSSQRVDIPESQDFVKVTLDETATTVDQLIAEKASESRRDELNPAVEAAAVNLNIAKPEDGVRRFKRYLRRNLQYPPAAMDAGIMGSVTLRFTIQPNGQVSNVVALSGPDELRAEAVRLIRQGPKWEIVNSEGRPIIFNYRLDFSL